MRTRFFAIALCCLLAFTEKTVAQPLVGGLRHEFGALVGVQVANLNSDPGINADPRVSFGGKVFWHYRIIGNWISIRAEAGIDSWGAKLKSDTSIALTYLTLPAIAIQGKLGPAKVYIGPQLNILLSAKQKDGSSEDVKDFFKSTDISGMAGVEFNLPFRLMVGARYNFSLGNISSVDGQTMHNSAFMAYAGFRLTR